MRFRSRVEYLEDSKKVKHGEPAIYASYEFSSADFK